MKTYQVSSVMCHILLFEAAQAKGGIWNYPGVTDEKRRK